MQLCVAYIHTDGRMNGCTSCWIVWESESCGGRTTCVSSASFLFYPFRSSFSFLRPTCLPEEKERKKGRERERKRERADKPLRRAFSRPVVKGKGAIAESLPCREVSVRRNRTTTKRGRERKRGWTGSGVGYPARKISDFSLANFKQTHLLDLERVCRIAAKVFFASEKRAMVQIGERWVLAECVYSSASLGFIDRSVFLEKTMRALRR